MAFGYMQQQKSFKNLKRPSYPFLQLILAQGKSCQDMRHCAKIFFFLHIWYIVLPQTLDKVCLSDRSQTDHEGSFVALLLADNAEVRKPFSNAIPTALSSKLSRSFIKMVCKVSKILPVLHVLENIKDTLPPFCYK